MRRQLIALSLLFSCIAQAQQLYSGSVVNVVTGKGIPFVSLGFIRANSGTTSDGQGKFSIEASPLKNDSLLVSAIGFESRKVSVRNWLDGRVIELKERSTVMEPVLVSSGARKPRSLNSFSHCSPNLFMIEKDVYRQIAFKFDVEEYGSQVTRLQLCKEKASARFHFRFYSIDSLNGCPSNDLTDSVIEVLSNARTVDLDLRNYNIVVPKKSFFVAIEWLFIDENKDREFLKVNATKNYHTCYQPYLKWKFAKERNADRTWVLRHDGIWQQLTSSANTRFLISVDVR